MAKKFLFNRRWYEHLTPREFHAHFEQFDFMFKEYLGRHTQTALPWDAAGIAGTPFRVKIGDPEPTFHFTAMLSEQEWNHFSIPPDKLQKITADVRVSVAGRSIDISSTGEIPITPTFRLEIVTDPHFTSVTQKFRRTRDPTFPRFGRHEIKKSSLLFSADVRHLVTNKLVHGKHPGPPRYVLYQHMFGDGTEYPMNGPFYVGITQRDWKKRWGEHHAAINRGSPLKFHRTFRERTDEGQITHIHHKIMGVVDDVKALYALEEEMIDGHWHDTRLLNMIPGGEKGIKYLHEHRILDRKVQPMPDHLDTILEKWVRDHPRKGLPAPWVSERWKDDESASQVICGREGRLSITQVQTIREMDRAGLGPEEIAGKVSAKNVLQVQRVATGKTYSRVK